MRSPWLFAVVLLTQGALARCEVHYNWEALLNTRRIAIITPFFCTIKPPAAAPVPLPAAKPKARVVWPAPTAEHASARKNSASTRKSSTKAVLRPAPVHLDPAVAPKPADKGNKQPAAAAVTPAEKSFHTQTLQTLTEVMQATLPERIAAGRVYQVVPESEAQAALRGLRWQPRDLFQERGAIVRGKFPTPDVKHIQQLAKRLKVDGVVVAAMREPASIGDGIRLPYELWMVNPFNMGVRRRLPHVLSPRIQAFLITADGETAWQDEQVADHPRTTPRTLKTLLVDWQEATEQAAQQLADSLHRQPPG